MTAPVKRGTYHRSCHTCGWEGTYDTAARADYAKRRHQCEARLARAARAKAHADRLAAIDRTPKPCLHKIANHQHGTRACYTLDRCRCIPCSKAVAKEERDRTRQKAYGRYNKYVDAQPIRDHIATLGAYGISLKQLGRLAGVNGGALTKIVYGLHGTDPTTGERIQTRPPAVRVTRAVADRILAIETIPENLADGTTDPYRSTEARTKLRALVRIGWSMASIAQRLGTTPSNGSRYFHDDGGLMLKATVDRALALYDELSMTLPPEDTKWQKIAAARARRYAAERAWAAPLDLEVDGIDFLGLRDDLDDVAIERRMAGDKSVPLSKVEKAALVERWLATGRTGAECERVTGINFHRFRNTRSNPAA